MNRKNASGHLAALITIVIWGTTFISTKILLADFTPIEILFFRFLLGLLALTAAYPKRLVVHEKKRELLFAAAGLCGVCLYYLLENIALTYTRASNVGVIISAAPFFTAVLSRLFLKTEEKPNVRFWIGFLSAMTGICLISLNGSEWELNPIGDLLAVAAAFVWAVYSLLSGKIGGFSYPAVQATRRIFLYGLVFMLPFLFVLDFRPDFQKLENPECVLNLIYLGLGASALCFVTWNYAVRQLGAVKTSVYIYMTPVITVAASVLVLREEITGASAVGMGLTVVGLLLSESKGKRKEGKENEFRK